jgi:hypothetical protein
VNLWGEALHSNYLEHGNYKYEKPLDQKVEVKQSGYGNWKLSQKRVEYLKAIKKLCDENNVRLVVLTAPLSYEHYKIAVAHPMHQVYLATLSDIFGQIWNFHTEDIKAYNTSAYFRDSTHMTPLMSSIILEKLLP